tara:strand:+ start:240 stop:932 length:693 start_codon:yes stop_codon:yes gene_type:complete
MISKVFIGFYCNSKIERFIYVIIILTFVIKMLTLLRTGYGKIMQLFYKDKTAKLHFREIVRQTMLFEPSVYRFLNSLEKDHILKSEKDGNLKKYSIKKTIRSYFLFEAFDLEKLEKLPSIRRNAIKIYLNNLPEKPIFAILFGSTAKGTYNKNSDIDILLITNKKINTEQAEKETDALTAMKTSTFQMKYKDFLIDLKMKDDKVVQSAINSGYPLINHIQYYEVIYNERI